MRDGHYSFFFLLHFLFYYPYSFEGLECIVGEGVGE